MKRKVNEIVKRYASKLSELTNIEAILVNDRAEIDVYDPNFTIDIDVFHSGQIIDQNTRQNLLESPSFFETSPVFPVDQFIVDELPVQLNYEDIDKINQVLDRIKNKEWVYRTEMSPILYRILKGQIIFTKNGWIQDIRDEIKNISDWFWQRILDSTRSLLENNLQKLRLAIVTQNHLLYQISLASIIDSICSFIFALDRKHKPSPTVIPSSIKKLDNATSEFTSWFEALTSPAPELNYEKKYEIAMKLTKGILNLKLE